MNETRPSTMLQRLPVILAVTAASYGLQVPAHAARLARATAGQAATTLPVDGRPVPLAMGTAAR